MSCLEILSGFKDIILIGVALTGAIVAIKGLGTWQHQLKGKSEYELSRRILVSLFKYRDALNSVRNPVMFAYEMPSPSKEEAESMNQEQIRFYGTSKAYQTRWDAVSKEKTSLYTDLLEAEAIWGNELKDLFNKIYTLENELFSIIRNYIEIINPDTSEATRVAIEGIKNRKRDIMYDSSLEGEDDEFKRELLEEINRVEKYLKPKLRHEKV